MHALRSIRFGPSGSPSMHRTWPVPVSLSHSTAVIWKGRGNLQQLNTPARAHTFWDIYTHSETFSHTLDILHIHTLVLILWTVPSWTPSTLPVSRAVCCEPLWLQAPFYDWENSEIVVCSLITLNWILLMCTCKYCKYLSSYIHFNILHNLAPQPCVCVSLNPAFSSLSWT